MSMFTSFWSKHGENIKSIAKGAVIAGIGASVTVALEAIGNIDFGENKPFVVAALSVLVNILRKYGVPVATATAKFVTGSGSSL